MWSSRRWSTSPAQSRDLQALAQAAETRIASLKTALPNRSPVLASSGHQFIIRGIDKHTPLRCGVHRLPHGLQHDRGQPLRRRIAPLRRDAARDRVSATAASRLRPPPAAAPCPASPTAYVRSNPAPLPSRPRARQGWELTRRCASRRRRDPAPWSRWFAAGRVFQ